MQGVESNGPSMPDTWVEELSSRTPTFRLERQKLFPGTPTFRPEMPGVQWVREMEAFGFELVQVAEVQ